MMRARRARLGLGATLAAIVLGVLIAAPTARADGGAAINVKIWGAQVTADQSGTTCTWTVTFNVTVVNISDPSVTLTYAQVDPYADYTVSSSTFGVPPAQIAVLNDAGLHAGGKLAPGATQKYMGYSEQFSVPCAATDGRAGVTIVDQFGSNTTSAPFLIAGVAQPVVTPQAVLLSLAGGGAVCLLLSRRQRRAVPDPE